MQQQPFVDYTRDIFHGTVWTWDWFRRPGDGMDIFALSAACPECQGDVDHSPGDSYLACLNCEWHGQLPEKIYEIGGWILRQIRQRIRSDDWRTAADRLRGIGSSPLE